MPADDERREGGVGGRGYVGKCMSVVIHTGRLDYIASIILPHQQSIKQSGGGSTAVVVRRKWLLTTAVHQLAPSTTLDV